MGFFKKLWKGVKKVGSIAQKAAPALAFIPGVGTAAALAIGGLGGLASGGWKGALKGAAGAGLGVLGKSAGIGGLLKGGLKNAVLGANGQFDLGDLGSIANLAGTALGAYGAYQGYKGAQADSQRARDITEQSMALANAEAQRANETWNSMAGLRQGFLSGVQGMSDPTNPFARNVFAQAAAPVVGAPGMGSGGPGMPPPPPPGPQGGGGPPQTNTSPGMIAAMAAPPSKAQVRFE